MEFREWLAKQELIINEDYKTAAQKFERENPETPPEAIKKYLADFKKIATKKFKQMFEPIEGVSVPKEKRHDIDSYKTFRELEALVDHVRGQVSVAGAHFGEDIDIDAKPIFENEDLVVYYADSPRACIKYRGNIPYSWCIARKDAGNMFHAYRFKEHEPSFYFVKNKKRTKEELGLWNLVKTSFSGKFKDPWHFFVLQVLKNTKDDDQEEKQYIITSANNDQDKNVNWNQVLEVEPLLNGLQNIFKPIPLSAEEKEDHERFSKKISDEEFSKLTYEKKNRYIDVYVNFSKELTDNQFKSLPEDLKNKYIGLGLGLSDAQYEMIKGSKLEERYFAVTLEKSKRILKDEFQELETDHDYYGLKNSELYVIQRHLNYKTITLEDIGKLAGVYKEPKVEENDDGEVIESGGWRSSKPPESTNDLLDQYVAAKGKISPQERTIIKKLHGSQAKIIELHGDEKINIGTFNDILKKNFVKEKGFKEEKVKEAFEKRKKEVLDKDEISFEEMEMILTFSEDVSKTINEIKDSALKEFFNSSQSIEWILKHWLDPKAAKTLAERLLQSLDKPPPHPILLAYAPDVKSLKKSIDLSKMSLIEIINTFISDTDRTNRRTPVKISPEKMQEIAETIFGTYENQMYWVILALAKLCKDPIKALKVAADNTSLFENINSNNKNVKDLLEFLSQQNPDLLQKIAEVIAATMSQSMSRTGREQQESLDVLVQYATNKARILQIVPEELVAKWFDSKGFDHVLSLLRKEDYLIAKDAFSDLRPHVKMRIGVRFVGMKEYVKSLKPEELEPVWKTILSDILQDQKLSQQDRSEIVDEILNKKQKFDTYDRPNYFVELIRNSSDKYWALKTILSKAAWDNELLNKLQENPNALFQSNEIQSIIELILSIKKNLTDAQLEALLGSSPNKDRTAQIIGLERLKKIAADPYPHFHVAKDWLKQKGLLATNSLQ